MKFDYNFTISSSQGLDKTPESITVRITNTETSPLRLSNLIFRFYVDDEGFYAISPGDRFLEKDLTLESQQSFLKTISIDTMYFSGYVDQKTISAIEMRQKLKGSKVVSIQASVSDLRRLANPLESSSLTWSNVVRFDKK
ncbi:hypothetical protein FPE01S_01_07830 [Flavihumibacter petaseus NBRC 106054]|uniref:Uncharacterized protein n=1 Tax=Flavihumibacter petaseus NBRC 106054 TaxID=1220578 RepID=A0A0E9MVZ8_9BACT|nr:hypothetical protein FPE01S_01_07830 [Flavihumibacter petaseus NBRC 106054]